MDVDLIIAQAQEQLQLVVKVQEKEQKEQIWQEEDRKAEWEEWSRVAVSDKAVVKKALERVEKELWRTFCQVILIFSSAFISDLTGL